MNARKASREELRGESKGARGATYRARRPRLFRFLATGLGCLVFVCGLVLGIVTPVSAASRTSGPSIDVTALNGEINAASQRFLTGAISRAESDGAIALVIQINTPGGEISAMQAILSAELSSTVPIITYVSPSGGYAASAGAFVTLAAPLAAMAPSTTIGASSPVDSNGSDLSSTMKAKVESVLVSDMTNIQQRYGRAVDPAIKMVTNAASYGSQQAQDLGIIDFQAGSLNNLLNQVNGRSVTLANGQSVTLETSGVSLHSIDQSIVDNLFTLLTDPNVIFLLFILAIIGIYAEISHPGMILPGVVGSISLLLFLFGIGTLTPNWAGLALMILSFVLLILDIYLPTHGALTLGAVVSLIIGALLFFNSGGPYQGAQVNPLLVYGAGAMVGGLGLFIVSVVVRTQRRPIASGPEGMLGARVTALTSLTPEGRVRYGGEDWAAVLDPPTQTATAGSELLIVSVQGLCLHVQLAAQLMPSVKSNTIEGA